MKISVIMPVYNSEEYLEAAVNSVLSQDAELEIIAVDDCSCDSSRELLLSLAEKDSRIKPFFNEKNIGVAAVRNKAIEHASGEFLAFCDSDDLVPDGAYKALLDAVGDRDIAIGAHCDRYDSGKCAPLCTVNREERKSLFKSLFTVSCLWTKLIRRSFVTANSLKFDIDMKIGEDVVFLAEAVTKNPTYSVTNALVYYHCQHDTARFRSLTHIYTLSAFKKHIECRERVMEILKSTEGVRDFIYLNFSPFINEFILKMPIGEELDEAFSLYKNHILAYCGFSENPALFKAIFGVEYSEFGGMSPETYTEAVRAVSPRERVLAEYESGRIGFSWIMKYYKAWLGFKLKGRKNKK